jgi:PAS domain S-box-containing protein
MSSTPRNPWRVIALGRFGAEIPPLASRLAALAVEPVRCADPGQLPLPLGPRDILLTELEWLNGLDDAGRKALGQQTAEAAAWVALTDRNVRFKEQVDWQRSGVSDFFTLPPDPDRLATLVEDLHDRLDGPPLRVLYLDDEQSALDYYGSILRERGLEVQAVQDPLLALDLLDEFRPDLLLADIEMPGCRGPELVTILRQRSEHAHLPVLFLTAMDSLQDLLQARAAAAEDFLPKPVAPALLLTAVCAQGWRHRADLRAETEHRRQEARARLRLEQLRMAIDEHAIVSTTDTGGRITYANDKFCALSGYRREELLGQNHRMVKSGLHPASFYDELWNTITAGKVWHGEVCNRHKDGTHYWVEATIVPILDTHGRVTQYLSIRTDITAQKQKEEELRISNERFSRGQAFANIGTWDWNIQTGELYWSERIAPLFGYPGGDLETSYENFLNAVHPDDRQAVIDAVNASVERNLPYEIEHRVVWPDGQVRWLLERGAVMRDAQGKPQHMLGVVQDIHERKLAQLALVESERRLRESEKRLALAVEGPGDGIWDWNMLTGEMPLSGNYEGMLGFARGELEPSIEAWVQSVHPDDLARVQQALQDYLSGKTAAYTVELRLHCKDGGYKWILCRGTVVARNEADEPVRMIGIHSDISERKEDEERLALFRRIFDASEQAVGITDSEGRMIYLNRAHEAMLDYHAAEVMGQPFSMFMPENERQRVAGEVMAAAQNNRGWAGLHTVQRKDGSSFVASSNVGFVKDAAGNTQYLFNIFTDFSAELARREELAQAKETAERANQAKSDFLSSMSHELRTPMNAIIGFAQMLEYDAGLNDDQHDNVHEILKAGRHLLDLINEVLDLAKIESGRIDLSLEPVSLSAVIDDCRQLIQPLAAAREIGLQCDLPAGKTVRADRVRLKQVLLNLLSNAVKYNRECGSIRLEATTGAAGRLRIAVIDTGPGIPAERLGELFQPFNRLDAERSEIEGTGIGLTITRRLVEMMGGEVGVASEVGKGSSFWIELPAEMPAAHAPANGAAGTATAAPEPEQQRQVLCIDDNPVNLKLIAHMLGMRPQLRVITAHTPELGIELALAHRPNLILLDINMPGMDGYQMLEVFKADARLRRIPVVAVTASAMPRDIERGKAAGFRDYLTKPLDIGVFLDTIDRCLAGGENPT